MKRAEKDKLIGMCNELAQAAGFSATWQRVWVTKYIPAIEADDIDEKQPNGATMRSCLETCYRNLQKRPDNADSHESP